MSKTINQSRWGFHPCSYEQYEYLRLLRKQIYAELPAVGRFNRWNRKTKLANRHGPEPLIHPVYTEVRMVYCYDEYVAGQIARKSVYTKRAEILKSYKAKDLDELFRLARTPLPTPEMAQAVDEVNSLNRRIDSLRKSTEAVTVQVCR